MIRAILGLALLLGLASGASAQSGPIDDSIYGTPSEGRWAPFFAVMPACDDPSVLGQISDLFSQSETIYWNGQNGIAGYQQVREIGFRGNGLSYIPRRYCIARAVMAVPPQAPAYVKPERTVVYSIASNADIVGQSIHIGWCVIGLDREHACEPDCAMLRPILERSIGRYKWLAAYGIKARY